MISKTLFMQPLFDLFLKKIFNFLFIFIIVVIFIVFFLFVWLSPLIDTFWIKSKRDEIQNELIWNFLLIFICQHLFHMVPELQSSSNVNNFDIKWIWCIFLGNKNIWSCGTFPEKIWIHFLGISKGLTTKITCYVLGRLKKSENIVTLARFEFHFLIPCQILIFSYIGRSVY